MEALAAVLIVALLTLITLVLLLLRRLPVAPRLPASGPIEARESAEQPEPVVAGADTATAERATAERATAERTSEQSRRLFAQQRAEAEAREQRMPTGRPGWSSGRPGSRRTPAG